MFRTDDRAGKALPVTAEVGSEGGSYAEPTLQVPAFSGHHGIDRMGSAGDSPSHAHRGVHSGGIAMDAASGAESGMLRYPTEPPAGPRQSLRAPRWRAGIIGAAAGAAAAVLVMAARRHRQSG